MTHMQTKTNDMKVETLIRTFYRISDFSKTRYIATVMLSYPELYLEFISNLDEKAYKKAVASA